MQPQEDPDNGLVFFRRLAEGQNFYLDAYPGNIYRRIGHNAEFVVNRHSSRYVGCSITMGDNQLVRKQPLDFDPNDLLGGDDEEEPEDCCMLCGTSALIGCTCND